MQHMLKAIYRVIFVMFLLLGSSCSGFLNIKPYGKTVPKTAEEFASLIHYHLKKIDEGESPIIDNAFSVFYYECYADNLDANLTKYPQGNSIPHYVGKQLSSKQDYYKKQYSVIKDCNIVIDNLKDDGTKLSKEVLATAYAVRGICYYNLLRNFCEPCHNNLSGEGLPLVKTFNMEERPLRATIGETVDFCVQNFEKSASYDIKNEDFRFNKDIMEAFLVRVYFWAGKYEKAALKAKAIVDKYPLIKDDAYKSMMESPIEKKGNILFKNFIIEESSQLLDYGRAKSYLQYRPFSKKFIDLFPEKINDIRYKLFVGVKRKSNKEILSCIRSAEMQLILSESKYHLGQNAESLFELNKLRSHRITGVVDYTMATLPPVNDKDIIKKDAKGQDLTPLIYAILCERRKELYLEGDRWFELKRNGCPEFWVAKQGRKYVTKKFMYTFPLPIDDIALVDGLKQNPGYENVR